MFEMYASKKYDSGGKRCAYRYCNSLPGPTSDEEKTSFFKFPEDPVR